MAVFVGTRFSLSVGALAIICAAVTALASTDQTDNSIENIRALLKSDRQLTNAAVARIQEASRAAMNGMTFHVTLLPNAGSPSITYDVQMGPSGYPRYFGSTNGWSKSFSEYTGQQARSCAGVGLAGELVLEYSMVSADHVTSLGRASSVWTNWTDDGTGAQIIAGARTRRPRMEMLDNVFEMLASSDGIAIGPATMIEGRMARALMKHHELRPADYSRDPIPQEIQDWLWIDVDALFIVRWEIMRAGVSTEYGYVFTNGPTAEMKPPHSLQAPTCVP